MAQAPLTVVEYCFGDGFFPSGREQGQTMGSRKKHSDVRRNGYADHQRVKDSIRKQISGKEKASGTFIQKQLQMLSWELQEASHSDQNQGLRGLIAVYLAGLACLFLKKE